MAKKKKPKQFRAVTAVKALARERIGTPRPETIVPDKRKKTKNSVKYKLTLRQMLSEEN